MATRKTAAKKEPAGEWRAQVVAEFTEGNEKVIWRAQKVKSPDNNRFLGIRKFVIKKNGDEQITATGFNIAFDGECANTLAQIRALLKPLIALAQEAFPTNED